MKKYVLVIDTSASSPENTLYVQDFPSMKQAKEFLASLGLVFAPAKIYCAVIGKKIEGNRYSDILFTSNGREWSKESNSHIYNPSEWRKVSDWKTIELFK